MKRKFTLLISASAPLAIALIVAAGCASGSAYSTGSYGSAPSASASTSPVGAAARVSVSSSSLGGILVDSKGRTLYLFEKDKNRRSACYGLCTTYWPPLLTHGKPLARAGAKQSLLGMTRRRNGSQQVTYAGHPLYRFSGDSGPGQTNGEGLTDFGAGWDALSAAGKKIESGG